MNLWTYRSDHSSSADSWQRRFLWSWRQA